MSIYVSSNYVCETYRKSLRDDLLACPPLVVGLAEEVEVALGKMRTMVCIKHEEARRHINRWWRWGRRETKSTGLQKGIML